MNNMSKYTGINYGLQENAGSSRPTLQAAPKRKRLILMRHAERMDRVFPGWIRLTNLNGTYSRYNLNQPRQLPIRRSELEGFHNDSPITQIGQFTALAVAEELAESYQINSIYSSPALRCIQTADQFTKFIPPTARIKVENSLFEWLGWYKVRPPKWMSMEELTLSNLSVDVNYVSLHGNNLLPIAGSESIVSYFERSIDFLKTALGNDQSETICMITHAPTIYTYTRYLLDISDAIPTREELDCSGFKIPYCSSIVLEKDIHSSRWELGKATKTMTYLTQSTKINYQFLLNKRNDLTVKHI